MIFLGEARLCAAGHGQAGRGKAIRHLVRQPGQFFRDWSGKARPGGAGRFRARHGKAIRHLVRQPGQFSGSGQSGRGTAGPGMARLGNNAFRWAVSPDTFGKQKQGNQSKTT